MPTAFSSAAGPTPEFISSTGELIEPPDTITSRRAPMRLTVPPSSTSTPTARLPSNRMRRTCVRVISFRFLRVRLGLR